MRILLVAPAYSNFPVGIGYISAALKNAGHQITCHTFANRRILLELLQEPFDMVATGGLSFQLPQFEEIAEIVKASSKAWLVIGGGVVTSEPELITKLLSADFSVLGEGEETIVELASALEQKRDTTQLQGIAFPRDGKIVINSARSPIELLDNLPRPDYESFGFSEYLDRQNPTFACWDLFDFPRVYPLLASRSCPYQCSFCYHPLGKKYRQRSISSILDEIRFAVRTFRINTFDIIDELFAQEESRILEFCRQFKEFTKSLNGPIYFTCSLRVSDARDHLLQALKDAGCFMVNYGFESYSAHVLKSMKKYISPEQIHTAIHKTFAMKMSIQANFIFGDPEETLETAQVTLDFWKAHKWAGILLFMIIVCPDSELYQLCLKKGLIKNKLQFIREDLFRPINMTSLSDEKFATLLARISEYTHRYATYAIPVTKTKNEIQVQCPHCGENLKYKNFPNNRIFFCKMLHCRDCRKRFFSVTGLYKMYIRSLASIIGPRTYRYLNVIKRMLKIVSPRAYYKIS
ncbi:MAG: B12-binding domain-containing radical SAM protein [Candidatus Riflebacteria bacterium]|nr:B12-binding domain-containing radical SAM protein [Candidatus Riflebacteria bacterium]